MDTPDTPSVGTAPEPGPLRQAKIALEAARTKLVADAIDLMTPYLGDTKVTSLDVKLPDEHWACFTTALSVAIDMVDPVTGGKGTAVIRASIEGEITAEAIDGALRGRIMQVAEGYRAKLALEAYEATQPKPACSESEARGERVEPGPIPNAMREFRDEFGDDLMQGLQKMLGSGVEVRRFRMK